MELKTKQSPKITISWRKSGIEQDRLSVGKLSTMKVLYLDVIKARELVVHLYIK